MLLLRHSLSKNLLIPSLSTLFYPSLRVNKKVQTSEAKELLCRWEVVGCDKIWRFQGILTFQFEMNLNLMQSLPIIACFFTIFEINDFFFISILVLIQLREYQKDLEDRLYLCLSKFDWSVFLILNPISYFFSLAFQCLGFLSKNYWSWF